MRILVMFSLLFLISCESKEHVPVHSDEVDEKSILAVMQKQEDDWNKADINSFMEGYWKSEELMFIGSSGINKGWDITLQRYLNTYPDKDAMGKLDFEIISLKRMGPDSYHMIGKYTLTRKEDNPSGHFTLVWRRIEGKWLIVVDQTC